MANLAAECAGLKLKNPLVVSSAGITETVEKMRRCQEAGAAAVVIKSWFEEEVCRVGPSPRYHVIRHDMGLEKSFSFFSYEQASEWDLDRYAQEVRGAKAELDIKIIASINCVTDEGWVRAARAIVEAGVDAIELNTSCPYGAVRPDGYYFRVDTELCKGCGLCIERCPLSNISAQSSVISSKGLEKQ